MRGRWEPMRCAWVERSSYPRTLVVMIVRRGVACVVPGLGEHAVFGARRQAWVCREGGYRAGRRILLSGQCVCPLRRPCSRDVPHLFVCLCVSVHVVVGSSAKHSQREGIGGVSTERGYLSARSDERTVGASGARARSCAPAMDEQVATLASLLCIDIDAARDALRRAGGNSELAVEFVFASAAGVGCVLGARGHGRPEV